MVGHYRGSATQESRKPTKDVWMKRGGEKALKEECVIDGVERFCEVESSDDGAERRFALIKSVGNFCVRGRRAVVHE